MQAAPKRGRPQEADPHQIAHVALQLFERRGFDQVTMAEIASAACVSRRTLFRLFPSKLDLVWEHSSSVRDLVTQRAASLAGASLQLGELFGELVEPVLCLLDEPEAAEMARRRLRLIADAPALLNHPTLRGIEAVIVTMVADASPSGTPPALVARTLVATTFAALLWWAEHGEGVTALEAARAAFRAAALIDEAEAQTPSTTRASPR
jgi:AcrR family transcriptional regulator